MTDQIDTATPPPEPATPAIELPDPLPIGQHQFEFLCGTAGTGKTTMARALYAQNTKGTVLAATTGIAAVNLGEGTTINALLKYFNTPSLRDAYIERYLHATIRKERRSGLRRIILDEVSMLGADQLTYLTKAIVEVTADEQAIGMDQIDENSGEVIKAGDPSKVPPPLGLTLVGDFGQLAPVPDEDPVRGGKLPVKFAFESPEWGRFAEHVTRLEKVWRQENQAFMQGLHAIRRGDVTAALQFFQPHMFHSVMDDQFPGSTVFAKNDAVDRYNQLRLDMLDGQPLSFDNVRKGKPRPDWKLIPDRLTLKEGALVMLLANHREYDGDEDERGRLIYTNGDCGYVVGTAPGTQWWMVKLFRTGGTVHVQPVLRENLIPLEPGRRKEIKEEAHAVALTTVRQMIEAGHAIRLPGARYDSPTLTKDASSEELALSLQYLQERERHIASKISEDNKHEIIGTIFYMPMRAAYGVTVHKTQGLTLDRVQINIRDHFFTYPGMLFVALSRCRTAEGLRIVGSQKGFVERCKVNPKVRTWL